MREFRYPDRLRAAITRSHECLARTQATIEVSQNLIVEATEQLHRAVANRTSAGVADQSGSSLEEQLSLRP